MANSGDNKSKRTRKRPRAPVTPMPRLTARELRFVAAYAGNAGEAALAAGYKSKTTGNRLLKKPRIQAAIQTRQEREVKPAILSRIERQSFWSTIVQDEDEATGNRLKASELLGRSEGDFLDRVESTGSLVVEVVRFSEPAPAAPTGAATTALIPDRGGASDE